MLNGWGARVRKNSREITYSLFDQLQHPLEDHHASESLSHPISDLLLYSRVQEQPLLCYVSCSLPLILRTASDLTCSSKYKIGGNALSDIKGRCSLNRAADLPLDLLGESAVAVPRRVHIGILNRGLYHSQPTHFERLHEAVMLRDPIHGPAICDTFSRPGFNSKDILRQFDDRRVLGVDNGVIPETIQLEGSLFGKPSLAPTVLLRALHGLVPDQPLSLVHELQGNYDFEPSMGSTQAELAKLLSTSSSCS
ncbi:hypothetical protein DL770_001479 [Monosporascus sp. CRB-9-2]|nr:hypothetical protein DL770_001479 [Monosporascus sp. CRB-9-2]